jgi:hypothetical protein
MPWTNPLASIRDSYVAAAFRSRENWTAAAVTVAVAAAVVLYARVPIRGDLVLRVDARQSMRSRSHASFIGFGWPTASGIASSGETASIVFNRPLPAAFELVLQGRCVDACDGGGFHIHAAGPPVDAHFETGGGRVEARIENPGRSRTISFEVPNRQKLLLTQVAVHSR